MSAKQVINDKLPGSVAAYSRCGQIKKMFIAEYEGEKKFKIGEHFAKLQAKT